MDALGVLLRYALAVVAVVAIIGTVAVCQLAAARWGLGWPGFLGSVIAGSIVGLVITKIFERWW